MAYKKEEIEKFKDIIITGIGNGKSLLSMQKEKNSILPSRPIIYNWLDVNHPHFDESFLNNYVRAREDSADLDAEKAEEIANKVEMGVIDSNQARVMLDVYKWTSGVKKPKKYGKTIDVTSGGEKIQPPTAINVNIRKPLEDE